MKQRAGRVDAIASLSMFGFMILLPALFILFFVLLALLPFLLLAGAIWLIVKFVRSDGSGEDDAPPASFRATAVHPVVKTQVLPASQPLAPAGSSNKVYTTVPLEAILPPAQLFSDKGIGN